MATVRVDIEGNASGLQKELKKADSSVMDFGRGLSSIAGTLGVAFGVGAVVNFARSTMSAADAVVTYAKGIGESVQAVVALTKAGTQSGVENQKVLNWLQKIKDTQETIAQQGMGGALAKELESIGINVKKFIDLSPAEAFNMLTEAAIKSGNGVSALNTVLGKMAASDAIDVKSIIEAAGGWEKYASACYMAAEAQKRLADQQDRIDKGIATTKEIGSVALDWFFRGHAAQFKMLDKVFGMSAAYKNISGMTGDIGTGPLESAPKAPGKTPSELMAEYAQKAALDASQKVIDKIYEKQFDDAYGNRLNGMNRAELESEGAKMDKYLAESIANKAVAGVIERVNKNVDMINKAIERSEKGRVDFINESKAYVEKEKAIDARAKEDRLSIQVAQTRAIEGISIGVPRLNGMESVGAIMGGTGGAAMGVAQRLDKLAEIFQDSKESLAKIDANTEAAKIALEGP